MRSSLHRTVEARGARGPRPAGRSAAFTLIELLVVVAIIALLMSILLPALNGAREKGKSVKCLANMRSTAGAGMNFFTERGRFPITTDEVGLRASDPDRQRFAYGEGSELLAWPVALAKACGLDYRNNWDWGVRAANYDQAREKQDRMKTDHQMMVCPSDRVRLATPWYPVNKGAGNNGLSGPGDPLDVGGTSPGMSYWGLLSYAVNEDVAGAEVQESAGPACWRYVTTASGCVECKGEYGYPPFTPCGDKSYGTRLQGNLEKVYRAGEVGLIFEAGRDEARQPNDDTQDKNLVLSSQADGPYLADALQDNVPGENRVPLLRHPRKMVNVLFADFHGASVRATKFKDKKPTEFAPQVRVSPYPPAECN